MASKEIITVESSTIVEQLSAQTSKEVTGISKPTKRKLSESEKKITKSTKPAYRYSYQLKLLMLQNLMAQEGHDNFEIQFNNKMELKLRF